jgi:RimJ/RimL family protein N-acetyltransferase
LLELRSRRLRLVEATLALVRAEMNDRAAFSRLLRARLPAVWPPPENDDASALWIIDYLAHHPDDAGWSMWYFVREGPDGPTAIGNGGFKGAPVDGTVEVGYSVVEEFQRQGYASEAVETLVQWAFGHAEVQRVIAETLPELVASQGVLRKLGFARIGGSSGPGIWRYERLRDRTEVRHTT